MTIRNDPAPTLESRDTTEKYIAHSNTEESAERIGGKAASLARLRDAGLPIPDWFVVRPTAFFESLDDVQQRAVRSSADPVARESALASLAPSDAVRGEIVHAMSRLDGEYFAVRSSAVDEDSSAHSFAGQFESFLFVPRDSVADRVADVWRSGFTERVVAYRRDHGLDPAPNPPAVLVQRMVDAEVAGVAFSADPVSGRRSVAVVASVFGLGTALVSGDADADTFRVDADGRIVEREIAAKRVAHRPDPGSFEGVRTETLDDARAAATSLSDERVRRVAHLVRHSAKYFGRAQDIEWAFAGDDLFLLQSRPITSLGQVADPAGALNLWDNSNIAESYGGVTTPLTFSFARRAYEEVYRQFCRMMRVPDDTIEATGETFRRMLGLIRGRVYYNLISWYRVLATLPGFSTNRKFMEQMMGVKEGVPDDVLVGLAPTGKFKDTLRMAGTVVGLIRNFWTLPAMIARFYSRLDEAMGADQPDLSTMRADELVAHYRDLERRLLTRWDAPLVNDFLAMIFYGMLKKQVETWCRDANATLQNDLLVGEGGIISTEPIRWMRQMAARVAPHRDLVAALSRGTMKDIRDHARAVPDFWPDLEIYLKKFGDRCLDELKLESDTLADDPIVLLRAVGNLAIRPGDQSHASMQRDAETRAAAEAHARKAIGARPLRRVIFGWVLANARARVRDRENLRFERTRVFGRVRRIFVELGKRFAESGALDDPRDVFYLEVEEALGYVVGTVTTTDLKGLVRVRKVEFERFRREAVPSDRFETRGIVHRGNLFQSTTAIDASDGDERRGLGCCPGVVRGRARVVADPRGASLAQGEILVAERTDPGWVVLFASAVGIVVERGSLLSHAAIVAREMGIPAIVSASGVTTWLADGDLIEIDGATGVVRKIEEGSDAQ